MGKSAAEVAAEQEKDKKKKKIDADPKKKKLRVFEFLLMGSRSVGKESLMQSANDMNFYSAEDTLGTLNTLIF